MRLHAGALHIWRANLDAVGDEVELVLDERERERAERIVREPARRRWVAARGVLRTLLGAYLDERPSALRFAYEARGKPMLGLPSPAGAPTLPSPAGAPTLDRPAGTPTPDSRAGGRLRFNLAHSGGLAIYALTELCSVGVDVELVARHPRARVHGREFLRAWVRHEAEGKRLGVGVGVGVGDTPERTRARTSRPWMAELDLGDSAVGAVALAVAPVDSQVYELGLGACGSILPANTTATRENEASVSSQMEVQEVGQRCGNAR